MKVCPTCSRPIGGNGRFCFACKLPVLRGHKWHVVGCYIVHDDCANPTMRVLVEAPEQMTVLSSEQQNPGFVPENLELRTTNSQATKEQNDAA